MTQASLPWLGPETFDALLLAEHPLLDVRAPMEFQRARFPAPATCPSSRTTNGNGWGAVISSKATMPRSPWATSS